MLRGMIYEAHLVRIHLDNFCSALFKKKNLNGPLHILCLNLAKQETRNTVKNVVNKAHKATTAPLEISQIAPNNSSEPEGPLQKLQNVVFTIVSYI